MNKLPQAAIGGSLKHSGSSKTVIKKLRSSCCSVCIRAYSSGLQSTDKLRASVSDALEP